MLPSPLARFFELQLLLDQLSCINDDDTECIMSISTKYAELLKASENHIPIDLYRLKISSTDSDFMLSSEEKRSYYCQLVWGYSLAYYCCCSLFGFGVKHMNAARHFRRYFSPKRLENIYSDKIKYRATVGMDRIAPKAFEDKLDENVQLISQKVLSGKYKFTRYREV